MSFTLNVEWTVLCSATPAVVRPCGRCGGARPFQSTGKFRLNANGNRLDAWLIYACQTCGKTWNRTVFERKPVGSVPKMVLEALHANDPIFAGQFARSYHEGDWRSSSGGAEFRLLERRADCANAAATGALLTILNPDQSKVRLDKILSRGFAISRKQVAALIEKGALQLQGLSPKALRRPVSAETVIRISAGDQSQVGGLTDWLSGSLAARQGAGEYREAGQDTETSN